MWCTGLRIRLLSQQWLQVLPWHGFDPWLRNFHIPWVWQEKERKREREKARKQERKKERRKEGKKEKEKKERQKKGKYP